MNEFDIKALTWDDNPMIVERSKKIAEAIQKHIKLNSEMEGFEYGCGTGLLSFNLIPYLKTITLADSSDGMLDMLRKKIEKHEIRNMIALKLDLETEILKDQKFDIIYTAMTMHHVKDVIKVLKEFHALLKPSGFLCVADLDKEDGSFHGPDFSGHKGFDREQMKLNFTAADFTNIKADTCFEVIRLNEQNQKASYPVFLMTGQKN